jgi:hypothetical protein
VPKEFIPKAPVESPKVVRVTLPQKTFRDSVESRELVDMKDQGIQDSHSRGTGQSSPGFNPSEQNGFIQNAG